MITQLRFIPASISAIVLLLMPIRLQAESPSVSYIFPAGGQRGTTVSVNIGGHYLHDSCAFEILGTGVQAASEIQRAARTRWFEGPVIPLPDSQQKENYPKDQAGRITIASDAALGFRRWRVWTSQGVTESMKFVVGDLPEIVEDEIAGDPIPATVTLPVTINGRIFPREDVDIWSFTGRAGESYTCEVMASRLGSPLDSRLEVTGPEGNRIAENTDGIGMDSLLRFTAPRDGVYRVRIYDINFDGLQNFVYRLTITGGVFVDHIYPPGGRRGSLTKFQLYGQNVPADPIELQLPGDKGSTWMTSVERPGTASNRFPIQLSDDDEQLETEPNDTTDAAPLFPLPAVLNGRIDVPGDVDVWRFAGKKDAICSLDVQAERIGSDLDSVLIVCDAEGKELARNDDMDGRQSDSAIQFAVPADGTYSLQVSERFSSRGGVRFAYRLSVTPAADQDFRLTLPADALTLIRGGEVKLKIGVNRSGGFAGEIALKVEGLTPGVTVTGDKIEANKNEAELTFKADATAKISPVSLQIIGTAQIGDQTVSHSAIKYGSSPDDLDLDRLLLAVAIPTPFKFVGAFQTNYAARGSTFEKHFTIDRGGFEGPIEIGLADRQNRHLQGVAGATVVVPAGQSDFNYAIKLPSWMEVGRTSRTCLMASGIVEEPDGSRHNVAWSSEQQNDQIIVLVDPGQLEVRAQPKSIVAAPGGSEQLRIEIGRGAGLDYPLTAELRIPDHVRGIRASPITIESGQSFGTLEIQFAQEPPGPFNMPFSIVATACPNGKPYTAETTIELVPPQQISAAP